MKKFLTLVAAAALTVSASAGTRVLYTQDFESVTSAADAGWTYGGASMDIQSDDFGSFLQLYQGATNGRNAQLTWGDDIYGENASMLEDGKYTVSFDFYPKQSSNNQYNSGITVLTNLTPPGNQPFLGRWTYLKDADGNNIEDMSLYQGYLFDLNQVKRESEDTGSIQLQVNGDANDLIVLDSDWYNITLEVDVNARTVDYSVTSLNGAPVTAGTRTVPATECDGTEISMYATGLWVMVARYQTQFCFDNINVSCESSQDVANDPSVALTGIGKDADENLSLNIRTYTITFLDGEILHLIGTDGNEETISYMDCDGNYTYMTETSGTLEAWTTSGDAESNHITAEVECTPYILPEATVTISAVAAGYGKTYTLTVSNAAVALQPKLFVSYVFEGENGEHLEATDESSGVQVAVSEAGTLTVTTSAFGYQATTTTVNNDIEFAEKFAVDFARMTADEIKAAGFAAIEDLNSSATSGENNWTARHRLFYYDAATAHVDEESGETVYDAVYPFGWSEDGSAVLHRWLIEEVDAELAASLFPNVTIWNGLAAQILQGVGLTQNATKNNYNPVTVNGLDENDFVMFNTIDNYGGDSNHPICNTAEEYYAVLEGTNTVTSPSIIAEDAVFGNKSNALSKTQNEDGTWNVVFPLYRIQTALTKVTAFYAKNGVSGINDIIAAPVENNDPYYYSIDGIRVLQPSHSGLYIHQGKKVYIVK